jgi:tryptophan 2,3-dioxygenase
VESFLEAHRSEVEAIIDATLIGNTSADDRALLEKRYDAQMKSAGAFLRASDIDDEEEQRRVRRIRAAATFIESYRELPLLAWPREIIDSVVALEQAFLIFRQRHARMVERVIGRRTGTGGSTGVDYLDSTALRYRVFRDVWAVRTILLRQEALPALENAESYGFVAGD